MNKAPVQRAWTTLLLRWELGLIWAVGTLAFAAVPVVLGEIGLSWDALNHHIYLGWIAEQTRFDRDLLAARAQAFQYPYLYWPVYRMAMANMSGMAVGIVLAILQALAIPPAWILARACLPGASLLDSLFRWGAVLLSFLGGVTLSLLDTTANDTLAAIPFLWALALGVLAAEKPTHAKKLVMASGLMAGFAVALKLSNGPLALALPWLWYWAAKNWRDGIRFIIFASATTLFAFALAYGPWGWKLWALTGNPIYPFYDSVFESLRSALGWTP